MEPSAQPSHMVLPAAVPRDGPQGGPPRSSPGGYIFDGHWPALGARRDPGSQPGCNVAAKPRCAAGGLCGP
eukprot:13157163-Alexandrium_andersonii.AAC.1